MQVVAEAFMHKEKWLMILLLIATMLLTSCRPGLNTSRTAEPMPTSLSTSAGSPDSVSSGQQPTEARSSNQVEITKWDLWASNKTMLRGINIYQRHIYEGWDDPEYYGPGPIGPLYTQTDLDELARLGANYVNISHPGLFTEESPFQLDEGSEANLDRLLDEIAKADMFAVISFRTGPGRSEFSFMGVGEDDSFGQSHLNDTVWQDEAAQDAWVEMWQHTAERYKDNPVVVGYDLMVEPNANAVFFDIYWPPDFYPAHANTSYDWNRFYPRIVKAIRDVDPETPILVGAMSWSQADWLPYLQPTDDPYTVYTFHQYAPHDFTHQEPDEQGNLPITYPGEMDLDWDGTPEPFDAKWLRTVLVPVDEFKAQAGMPVAVNEYGVMRFEPGAAEYISDLTALFEERGLNYALWSWMPQQVLQYGGIQEFEYRFGPDPENRVQETPNDLMRVIANYWQRNVLRPSSVWFR